MISDYSSRELEPVNWFVCWLRFECCKAMKAFSCITSKFLGYRQDELRFCYGCKVCFFKNVHVNEPKNGPRSEMSAKIDSPISADVVRSLKRGISCVEIHIRAWFLPEWAEVGFGAYCF